MQNTKEHIRHCLLYDYQLGHSAPEAARNICLAIGSGDMSISTACRLFERFQNKDYSLKDEQKSGRPSDYTQCCTHAWMFPHHSPIPLLRTFFGF